MDKREVRRHHHRRMKAKARSVFRSLADSQNVEKWANNLKMCSCHGCCNSRRSGYYKNQVTKQEHVAFLMYLEVNGNDEKIKHCGYGKYL